MQEEQNNESVKKNHGSSNCFMVVSLVTPNEHQSYKALRCSCLTITLVMCIENLCIILFPVFIEHVRSTMIYVQHLNDRKRLIKMIII